MSAQICINEQVVDLDDDQMGRSLLQVLRDDLNLTGTKEGCASGDCGACTIVACKPDGSVHTANSCITPAGAYAGGSIATIEALTPGPHPSMEQLHPIQRAMVELHGAQCGFCTPGFIMSMFGAQLAADDRGAEAGTVSRTEAARQIGGNLCRCTGYRPILDALDQAWKASDRQTHNRKFDWLTNPRALPDDSSVYVSPRSVDELIRNMQLMGDDVSFIAGSTDAWLASSQQYQDPGVIIDLSRVEPMRQINLDGGHIRIGAAVTLAELEIFFSSEVALPAITDLLHRFGSKQVRARATAGGNIGNASPIADLPPLLICLDANLVLMNRQGQERSVRLDEYYLGYKQTQREVGEVITCIVITVPEQPQHLHAYKISKREEDDISSVMGAFYLPLDDQGAVTEPIVAYGGVAATPVRLREIERLLSDAEHSDGH